MTGPPKKILLASDLSARCDRAPSIGAVRLGTEWKAQFLAVHVMENNAGIADKAEIKKAPLSAINMMFADLEAGQV